MTTNDIVITQDARLPKTYVTVETTWLHGYIYLEGVGSTLWLIRSYFYDRTQSSNV